MGKALGKTLAAIAAALAAVLLALNGARLVVVPPHVLLSAIVTSAALAALSTTASAWGEWRERRRGVRQEAVEFQLSAALWAIVDQVSVAGATTIDFRDLGLAIYGLQRRRWRPWRRRLRRRYRVRAAHRPATSDVDWQPGKGVIGQCVSQGKLVAIDLVDLYAGLGEPTAADWRGLPDDIRLGLDHQEFGDLRGKYEVVVAVPITDDSGAGAAVLGCIALDGPHGLLATLSAPEVVDLLNNLTTALLLQHR